MINEGNLEGYSWNPYKEENYPLINEWLPEEYAISPGVSDIDDIFQFREFPWMEDEGSSLGGGPTLPPEMFESNRLAGMDDSLQSLLQQIGEYDPNNPDHQDIIELLQSDIDMNYPWAT